MSESFEAKKHAWRQTQDGIVVSFVIHPNDIPTYLALSPLGTRFGVAVAEIGDNENPVEPIDAKFPSGITPKATPFLEGWEKVQKAKERKPFDSLPLSQQAALRCGDPKFRQFMARDSQVFHIYDLDMAADEVRRICGVTSRSQIVYPGESGEEWNRLEGEYQSWLTTQRYADSRR